MAEIAQLKVGNIVELKSGGPRMTVEAYSESFGQYRCQWFAGKKLESGFFPVESLQIPAEVTPATK